VSARGFIRGNSEKPGTIYINQAKYYDVASRRMINIPWSAVHVVCMVFTMYARCTEDVDDGRLLMSLIVKFSALNELHMNDGTKTG